MEKINKRNSYCMKRDLIAGSFEGDEEGRIQVPKKVRERLGIKHTVKASVKGHSLIIKAEPDPLEELGRIVKTRFKDIEKELPALRKAAEKQLFKDLSVKGAFLFQLQKEFIIKYTPSPHPLRREPHV